MKVYKTCVSTAKSSGGGTATKAGMKGCQNAFKTSYTKNGGNAKKAMGMLNKTKNNFGTTMNICMTSAGGDSTEMDACEKEAYSKYMSNGGDKNDFTKAIQKAKDDEINKGYKTCMKEAADDNTA